MPWARGAHRHIKAAREPQTESPSKSAALRERLNSPWLVVGQYIFNIAMVLLIFWLTGNQAEFQQTQQEYSDYLNGKGDQRDAERDQAEKDRQARSDATHQVLCDLINKLESDLGRELPGMRNAAECQLSPFQPGSLPDATSQLGPIVPGAGTSSGSATPGSQTATGDRSGGAGGRESSPATGSAGGGEAPPNVPGADKPAPPPPADGDGGGLVDGFDLCAPFLGCLL